MSTNSDVRVAGPSIQSGPEPELVIDQPALQADQADASGSDPIPPMTAAPDTKPVTRQTPKRVRKLLAEALYAGPTVTEDQLVGLESCVRQLNHQIKVVERPEMAARMGLVSSGTLFIGSPGTGKTHVARYLAGRLDLPLYQLSADQFDGDPKLVHQVFRALNDQRAILFIDEISILAQKREYSHQREMLTALLASLDGLAATEVARRLWVIGACTPDIDLDPAIHRSGRLGVVVEFTEPSEEQRGHLFRLYLGRVPHTIDDAGIARLAAVSNGATGADINDWVSQSAAEALADDDSDEPVIASRHMELVVARRGFIAAERPHRGPTHETAIHEAAHAVLAYHLFGAEALGGVTSTFGLGDSLGRLSRGHFQFSDDWLSGNPPDSVNWVDYVTVNLAGLCAENEFLGKHGPGSISDVVSSTELITDQLDRGDTDFGPSWSRFEMSISHHDLNGGQGLRDEVWSLTRARFRRCMARTEAIVREQREAIERLSVGLLESKTTLTGEEIVALIESIGGLVPFGGPNP